MTVSTWGLIIASGKGEKFAPDIDTSFLNLGSKPVLIYSLTAFEQCADIEGVVIVAPKERIDNVKAMVQIFGCSKVKRVVAGAANRQGSVLNGLRSLDEYVSIVTIHDASRPTIQPDQISETIKVAKRHGSGIMAARITDPIKQIGKGSTVEESVDNSDLWAAQTPQSFKLDVILKACETAAKKKAALADDSQSLALIKQPAHLIENPKPSVKINGPVDLQLAELVLRR